MPVLSRICAILRAAPKAVEGTKRTNPAFRFGVSRRGEDALYPSDYSFVARAGCAARVAVQRGVGLLSLGRAWPGSGYPFDSAAAEPDLAAAKSARRTLKLFCL